VNRLSSGLQKSFESTIRVIDHNVRFRTDLAVKHKLRVILSQLETGRDSITPEQSMPEPISIEDYRGVEVGNPEHEVVELSEQRSHLCTRCSATGTGYRIQS
jgi:hypothetical protein